MCLGGKKKISAPLKGVGYNIQYTVFQANISPEHDLYQSQLFVSLILVICNNISQSWSPVSYQPGKGKAWASCKMLSNLLSQSFQTSAHATSHSRQRPELRTLFCIRERTDASDWLVRCIWGVINGESVCWLLNPDSRDSFAPVMGFFFFGKWISGFAAQHVLDKANDYSPYFERGINSVWVNSVNIMDCGLYVLPSGGGEKAEDVLYFVGCIRISV